MLELDDAQDASVMCTVGRRASVAQGRALVGIWERSFRDSVSPAMLKEGKGAMREAVEAFNSLCSLLRITSSATAKTPQDDLPLASAHLAPLFGLICLIFGMSIEDTAYVFMLSHVKALLSAAVRASLFGPYHAQKSLASIEVQEGIKKVVQENWNVQIEDAGQSIPVMDLWVGRHEMLYSRIFNS